MSSLHSPAPLPPATKPRIGLLTSGGDCAGLNAVIRAVVLHGTQLGFDIIGIQDGTHGLLSNPRGVRQLTLDDLPSGLIREGGTILGTTNKGDPFAYIDENGVSHDRSAEIGKSLQSLELQALIGIGGDGSLKILHKLCSIAGLGLIGIPKTIDNDVAETETSIGFHSAVAVATEALDRLQPTAASHDRVMILEVMGRDAGYIALHSGIAGGADIILIPEIKYDIQKIAAKIREIQEGGRNFALMVVSEAVKPVKGDAVMQKFADGQKRYGGIGNVIAEAVTEATGAETRVTVLGHVQRGAEPTPSDRIMGSAFGVHAVDLVAEGKRDRLVAWHQRQVIDMPLVDAIQKVRAVEADDSLLRTARALGICLGDQ